MLIRHLSYYKNVYSLATVMMVLFSLCTSHVQGHAYSSSLTTINLTKARTEILFAIDDLSAIELSGGELRGKKGLEQKQFDAIKHKLKSKLTEMITLEINGEKIPWPELEYLVADNTGKVGKVELKAYFPPVPAYQPISLTDNLYLNDLATNYVNLLTVNYGPQINTAAIAAKERSWVMVLTGQDYNKLDEDIVGGQQADLIYAMSDQQSNDVTQTVQPTSGWYSFFKLGMHHILFGFDHLLFLFSLLIVRQTIKQYVALITSFTLAHSLTLTLSVLNLVDISAWIVEPAIALSICYVAIENIFRKNMNRRWMITFVFGLIHGMGFADILKEMNIPKKELAVDLISFNLGIEAVQLVIVLALLPLIYIMHRSKVGKYGVILGSAITFILGMMWLIERVFLI